uniref:Putative secreted protein n=1 Tax=Ixodes ricinus TaxID=34613 RepID=A0A6B0TWC2_IXORI
MGLRAGTLPACTSAAFCGWSGNAPPLGLRASGPWQATGVPGFELRTSPREPGRCHWPPPSTVRLTESGCGGGGCTG